MTWRFHSFFLAKVVSQPAKSKTQLKGRRCCRWMWASRSGWEEKLGCWQRGQAKGVLEVDEVGVGRLWEAEAGLAPRLRRERGGEAVVVFRLRRADARAFALCFNLLFGL